MINISHFKRLVKKDIQNLLLEYTFNRIAKKYNTNKEEIRKHVATFFPNDVVGEYFDGILVDVTEGAWLCSKEREYYLTRLNLKNYYG